jgi:hypothetical protein
MAREAFLKCHNPKGLIPGIRSHCLTIHLQVEHGVPIPTKLLKLWDLELMRHCQVWKPRHVGEIDSTEGV